MTEKRQESFQVAVNERTSFYEVHKSGCKHLISGHLEPLFETTGESGEQVARDFESRNDGCLTKLAPCARTRAASAGADVRFDSAPAHIESAQETSKESYRMSEHKNLYPTRALSDRDRQVLMELHADKIAELRPLMSMPGWRSAFEAERRRFRTLANGTPDMSAARDEYTANAVVFELLLAEEVV